MGTAVAIFGAIFVAILMSLTTPGVESLANATSIKQCGDKYFSCYNRCAENASAKYGKGSKQASIEVSNCDSRTCLPQLSKCNASASDAPRPNAAVNPGSPSPNLGTKVAPGGAYQGSDATIQKR